MKPEDQVAAYEAALKARQELPVMKRPAAAPTKVQKSAPKVKAKQAPKAKASQTSKAERFSGRADYNQWVASQKTLKGKVYK